MCENIFNKVYTKRANVSEVKKNQRSFPEHTFLFIFFSSERSKVSPEILAFLSLYRLIRSNETKNYKKKIFEKSFSSFNSIVVSYKEKNVKGIKHLNWFCIVMVDATV